MQFFQMLRITRIHYKQQLECLNSVRITTISFAPGIQPLTYRIAAKVGYHNLKEERILCARWRSVKKLNILKFEGTVIFCCNQLVEGEFRKLLKIKKYCVCEGMIPQMAQRLQKCRELSKSPMLFDRVISYCLLSL